MHKTGENVYTCDGVIKDKEGNVIKNKDGSNKRCGNFYIKSSFVNTYKQQIYVIQINLTLPMVGGVKFILRRKL